MPTYQYRCAQCAESLEVVQKFSDEPLAVCPQCNGELRKVFSAVGVVFKGSGFYKTDSRSKTSTAPAKPPAKSEVEAPAPAAAATTTKDASTEVAHKVA